MLPDTPTNLAIRVGFAELPVKFAHTAQAALLPPIHANPSDRMLIAQAKVANLALATVDPEILRYDVALIYASSIPRIPTVTTPGPAYAHPILLAFRIH